MGALSDRWRQWAKALKRDGVTLWMACRHPRTPWYAKALALLVVAYALSPIDLIPDVIPVLGFVDDVLLLPGLIWLTLRLLPAPVRQACRAQADAWLQSHRPPVLRWGAVWVVGVWVGVLVWFIAFVATAL
ncbi:MAG: hypothetical protein RIQ97_1321 [Pseudomonadota bacterium]